MDKTKIKEISFMTTKKKAAGLDALTHVAIPAKKTVNKQESKQPPAKKTKAFPFMTSAMEPRI